MDEKGCASPVSPLELGERSGYRCFGLSNAEEVELFLNGKSLGIKKKEGDDLDINVAGPIYSRYPQGYFANSRKGSAGSGSEDSGPPARLVVTADRSSIKADGNDLSFLTVEVVDANGVIVPDADNLVKFSVEGPGILSWS